MPNSHAVAWAEDAPTPAQLKELFAQIESRQVTKRTLQILLRGAFILPGDEIHWFAPRNGDRSVRLLSHLPGRENHGASRPLPIIQSEPGFWNLADFLATIHGLELDGPVKYFNGQCYSFR
jgi:hypothetical protein